MTYQELCLIRFILENVKEGDKVNLSDNEMIDVDSIYNYFNNVITDIEKDKAKNPRREYQAFRLLVDVRKVRGVEDVKERVDEKEKDPEKGEEGQRKQSKDSRPGVEHTKDSKSGEHSRERIKERRFDVPGFDTLSDDRNELEKNVKRIRKGAYRVKL